MPNLSDSLIASFGSGFDKAAEESMNSAFLNQKGTWISKAVGDFIKYNTAPNTTLGNIEKLIYEKNTNHLYYNRSARNFQHFQFHTDIPSVFFHCRQFADC